MATSESIRNPVHRNHITRRKALAGTAAAAAVALPAAAAVAATEGGFYERFVQTWKDHPEMPRRFAGIASTGADPHIGWWREFQQLERDAEAGRYAPGEDELIEKMCELENLIVRTAPTSPEAVAIISTVALNWQNEVGPIGRDPDQDAVETLARYFLAGLPPDVLRRAGLEGVA